MNEILGTICLLFILIGAAPVISSFAQFILVGLHGLRNHYSKCDDYTPRVAFVVPAWNEGDVISSSIDSLMRLSYPKGSWRIYVVDDASTDETPAILKRKMSEYPGHVFHLRREVGGQGKAHTLNHGLRVVLADDWAEAIMIMDADVLFEPSTLRRMTRHLADDSIGAVTAYIKEGSENGNSVTRFIAFEYIAAQAASRRAQNVLGVLACLAGGAQLHSRANLLAIGGQIDASSLAEDTFTTFKTQLAGKRALFDPNAVVWAEEPDSLQALWKQRLRWARGNLQLTIAFLPVWFHPKKHAGLGSIAFGVIWFGIVLMPVLMGMASIGLIGLHWLKPSWATISFGALWGVASAAYLFETLFSFLIDPVTARRVWFEGLMFPGLISLAAALGTFIPGLYNITTADAADWTWGGALMLFTYAWISLCMLAAWGVYELEKLGIPQWLRDALLVLVGYGPLLSAISVAAMVAEWKKTDRRWDKTMKTGRVRIPK